MAFKDLREYINKLDDEGEVQHIKREVDWNLEVGAISRRVLDLKAASPLFEKIEGYPEGYRIFSCPFSASGRPKRYFAKLALALEMNPESSVQEIQEEYIKRKRNPLKPNLVSTAPCKEEIHLDDEVDLFEFPVPFIHEGDGGRYLGTWHTIITRDPDSGWVNWGMYRLMVLDKNSMGCLLLPFQHIGVHYYQKYEARNRPMEFAVAIGTEPITALISAAGIPEGINEVDIIGGLRGEPLDVVKCERVDLEVPAGSEVVLEGEILPGERRIEGPFTEFPGYRVTKKAPRPVLRVKAITHRRSPILTMTCTGVPVEDSHIIQSLLNSAILLDEMREKRLPVKMVYFPPQCCGFLAVISTAVPYYGYPKYLASVFWSSKMGRVVSYLIIVGADIDPTNMDQVLWALSTRCHPYRGIHRETGMPGHDLMAFLNGYERDHGISAATLFDCTWPKDWVNEDIPLVASFEGVWPHEIQEKVLKNWKAYGYPHE